MFLGSPRMGQRRGTKNLTPGLRRPDGSIDEAKAQILTTYFRTVFTSDKSASKTVTQDALKMLRQEL